MPTIMEVQARLTGNASGMVKSFKEGEAAASSATKSMQDKAKRTSEALDKIALPAAAVGAGVGLILKDMGNLASEAEQNVGAVESVFKDYANEIKKNSKSASTDLGLSASSYQQFSAKIGSQLKNLGMPMDQVAGSTDGLIKKGADLASMFGGDTSQAVDALSALLRGETDPIERYGISIKQTGIDAKMAEMGLVGLTGEAEKNARLTATMALIQEQSADATGNFAREAGTAAGAQQRATAAWEDAKTTMGEALLPAMTRAAQVLQWFSGIMVEHKGIIMPVLLAVAGLATGIVALAGAMHVVTAAMQAASVMQTILSKAFLSSPIGWIILGLAALAAGFVWLWNNVEGFRNFWMDLWTGITESMGPVIATVTDIVNQIGVAIGGLFSMLAGDYSGGLVLLDLFPADVVIAIIDTIANLRMFLMGAFFNIQMFMGQVFAAIPGIIQGFLDFMTGTFIPVAGQVFQAIGAVAMWLWQNVFIPVFNGIMFVIMGFVSFFQAIWPGISGIFQLIGNIAVWLWTGVIVPAFQGIMTVVGFMVNWFMTFVWPSLSSIFQSIGKIFMNLWTGVFAPVIGFLAVAFFWLLNNVIAPVFNTIVAVVSNVVNFFMTHVWPIIQKVIGFIGAIFFWLMTNVIGPVFGFILGTIANFVAWLAGDAQPLINAIVTIIGNIFTWLWESIIQPVWNGIVAFISTAINLVIGIFNGIIWFITGPLATIFRFLWEFVIMPVFEGIKNTINTAITIIVAIFQGIMDFIFGPLAAIFRWLWEVLIRPVMEGIGNTIRRVIDFVVSVFVGLIDFIVGRLQTSFQNLSNFFGTLWQGIKDIFWGSVDWIRNTVLQPFIDFFNGLPGVFDSVKNAIGVVWEKIKDVFSGPVKFVVNTVLNDGIIAGYNKLNDIVSLPDIPKLNLGFADGGYTGSGNKYAPAGIVHGGEFVINKEATDHIRRTAGMGYLDSLNHGRISDGPSSNKDAAFSGPAISAAQRSKNFTVNPLAGINMGVAAGMWDGAAGVKVSGNGGGTHPVNTSYSALGGILALANMSANTIRFATDGPFPSYSPDWKTAVAAHEIGHTLGLEHINNRGALMNPIVAPGSNPGRPTGIDIRALQAIYPGGTGKAGIGGAPNGGGGGGALGDGIRELLQGLKDKINKAFPDKNIMKDFGVGILDKVGNAMASVLDSIGNIGGTIVDNVKGMFGAGINRWRETAKKALEHTGNFSEGNLNALMRRMKQESDGNPNAVNNWDSNATAGTPSKGLMQTIQPTFDAYRDKSLKNDIFDPMANIVAAINYTKARYGDLQAGWGRPGGYARGGYVEPKLFDNGGMLPPGLTLTNNKSGRPEYIMTASDMDDLKNGARNITIYVENPLTGEMMLAKMKTVAEDVTEKSAGKVVNAARRSRGITI